MRNEGRLYVNMVILYNHFSMFSFYIETYGCQMNEADSERIHSLLLKVGFCQSASPENATLILLNTCSVREHANLKIFNRIAELRRLQKSAIIGIAGCMATHLKEELLQHPRLKIDFLVGPNDYQTLPSILKGLGLTTEPETDFMTHPLLPIRQKGVNALVPIMQGCNNFCAYCVVPYTRGREQSKKAADILSEIRLIAQEGFPQVTLLGQNVNSYQDGETDFADLLSWISDIEGIKRIRFMSPHPKDFSERVLKIIRERPNLCKHLHLPLQSGNTRILKKMNRHYSKEDYLNLVDMIRSYLPDIAMTTDIIVGFPTETDLEFEDTLDVMQRVRFDSSFIFKYSERKNTLAYQHFPDDIGDEKKTQRIVLLNKVQQEISLQKNQHLIGQSCSVLIDEEGTKKNNQAYQGRTDSNKRVIISTGSYHIGELIDVQICGVTPHVLRGA